MIWSCNSLNFSFGSRSTGIGILLPLPGAGEGWGEGQRATQCRAGQQIARLVALVVALILLTACATSPLRNSVATAPPIHAVASNEIVAPPTASLQQGWRILFDQRLGNCAACHSIPNEKGQKTGIQSTFAPALDGVAARYSAARLRQWVVDARKINPDTMMPPFGQMLTPQQVTDVLAALQTLR
jgi:sulfur oxidation c-type cytochrome SoxX